METPDELVTTLYADRGLLPICGTSQWFMGPKSIYSRLVHRLSVSGGQQLLDSHCLSGDAITIDDVCNLSGDERLRQLARLRLAGGDYMATDLIDVLSYPAIDGLTAQETKPRPSEQHWFRASQAWLDQHGGAGHAAWSVGYWRALGVVSDFLNETGQPLQGTAVEKTPILIANETLGVGRVLWLVAERMPGPPIVTPHWWRLGLVNLGQGEKPDLLHQIQTTMRRGLYSESQRWQIRWWLETCPGGGNWHASIDAAPSIQAAAASLVLALAEDRVSRPILDSRAAVSAELDEGEQLCDVGHLQKKIEACRDAGIQCLVLSRAMVDKWRAFAAQHAPELRLVPATRLSEVFEILQATSPTIQAAKQRSVMEWGKLFVETETESRFVEAAKKEVD